MALSSAESAAFVVLLAGPGRASEALVLLANKTVDASVVVPVLLEQPTMPEDVWTAVARASAKTWTSAWDNCLRITPPLPADVAERLYARCGSTVALAHAGLASRSSVGLSPEAVDAAALLAACFFSQDKINQLDETLREHVLALTAPTQTPVNLLLARTVPCNWLEQDQMPRGDMSLDLMVHMMTAHAVPASELIGHYSQHRSVVELASSHVEHNMPVDHEGVFVCGLITRPGNAVYSLARTDAACVYRGWCRMSSQPPLAVAISAWNTAESFICPSGPNAAERLTETFDTLATASSKRLLLETYLRHLLQLVTRANGRLDRCNLEMTTYYRADFLPSIVTAVDCYVRALSPTPTTDAFARLRAVLAKLWTDRDRYLVAHDAIRLVCGNNDAFKAALALVCGQNCPTNLPNCIEDLIQLARRRSATKSDIRAFIKKMRTDTVSVLFCVIFAALREQLPAPTRPFPDYTDTIAPDVYLRLILASYS